MRFSESSTAEQMIPERLSSFCATLATRVAIVGGAKWKEVS